jgi:Glycosyl hydrolase family 9./N-terminal ig-like domain of cellulase.
LKYFAIPMKTLRWIVLLFISYSAKSQVINVWDGENGDINNCEFQYGQADNLNAHSGQWCFKATPDAYHQPVINLKCSNTWRTDISEKDEIWFYAKANKKGALTRLNFSGWPNVSRSVSIAPYIQDGYLDTFYKLIRIPIDSLKTTNYKLQSIEYLYLDTSSVAGLIIYADDFSAKVIKPDTVTSVTWLSDNSVKISVNRSYDTSAVKVSSNYLLSSNQDANYLSPIQPDKIGLHYYVKTFDENVPNPLVTYELFLQFPFHLQKGKDYQLTVNNIRNRSGIDFNQPIKISFNYNDLTAINHSVKVNQVGYLSNGPKYAAIGNYLGSAGVLECNPSAFEIWDAAINQKVYSGTPVFRAYDLSLSGEKIYECDFSAFKTWGRYFIYVPGIGRSYEFVIGDTVYNQTYYTAMRAFYYQRCGTALTTPYADARWTHSICHNRDGIIHSSWSYAHLYNNEPINSIVNVNGGWHDAGDYGKYIPNGTLSAWRLFFMYELYPENFYDNELNIPESGNGVPDILDELKWQIDGELNMQMPDGGVSERVITTNWALCMPDKDTVDRYLSEKTTYTTAEYSAIMAMAYRNFKKYWPAYADTCLARSKKAFQFLLNHSQSLPIGGYTPAPGIGSGPYVDSSGDTDERAWAAAELYKSTGDTFYQNKFLVYWSAYSPFFGEWNPIEFHQIPASFAYATTSYPVDQNKVDAIKNDFLNNYIEAQLVPQTDQNYYRNANRTDVPQWIGWGSFAQSSKYSWWFIVAHYLSGNYLKADNRYITYALINLNTQLGLNPQDKTYITGVGYNNPKNPCHRPSIHDNVEEPVPGIPVFGPIGHLSEANVYDGAVESKENLYPTGEYETDPYPIFRKYFDCYQNVGMSEFSIGDEAITASVFGYFKNTLGYIALANNKIHLNAKPLKSSVSLVWNCIPETEKAVAYQIERSKDGVKFDVIYSVNVATANNSKCQTLDKMPLTGDNFYRLKLIVNKTTPLFSNIEKVSFANDLNIKIYPVPSKDMITVEWDASLKKPMIQIMDESGKVFRTNASYFNCKAILDLSHLSKGLYFIQIISDSKSFADKVVRE